MQMTQPLAGPPLLRSAGGALTQPLAGPSLWQGMVHPMWQHDDACRNSMAGERRRDQAQRESERERPTARSTGSWRWPSLWRDRFVEVGGEAPPSLWRRPQSPASGGTHKSPASGGTWYIRGGNMLAEIAWLASDDLTKHSQSQREGAKIFKHAETGLRWPE